MKEEWKSIQGYNNLYVISNLGNIMSAIRQGAKGGLIKPRVNDDGYLYHVLSKDNKRRTVKLHRVVAEHFVPNPDGLQYVNHEDGNKLNCSASNLKWCTQAENIQHAFRTGLSNQVGFKNNNSKIKSFETVNDILADWRTGDYSQKYIAEKYGVSQATISTTIKKFGLIEAGLAIDKTKETVNQ